MTHVIEFAAITADMIESVGGKALNLGIVTAAGLPVPSGFCITTDAYRRVVGDRLDDLFADLSAADEPTGQARLAAQARERVLGSPLPDDLTTAVLAAYAELGGDEPVAVRSSATAEDLAYASFAGQQDTYLNVVGADAMIDAIRRCWASLWTDRAVSYRSANGIGPRSVTLAVVVQRMVQAAAAGVMFTANPVTGNRTETVIDASPGLGEAVVSGAVNPDHFVVGTADGVIRQRRLGDKTLMITARPGGGTESRVVVDGSTASCLTDGQLRDLTALGARVQQLYGAPQDTEWALDADGILWLTQARPITTLFPKPPDSPDGSQRLYFCMSLAQGLTRPITPVGLATFRLVASSIGTIAGRPPTDRYRGPLAFTTIGERAFVDITGVLRNPYGRKLVLAALKVMEARAATVIAGLGDSGVVPVRGGSLAAVVDPIARVVLIKGQVPLRVAVALASPAAARRAIARFERTLRSSLTLPANATPEQRLDFVDERLASGLFLIMPKIFAYAVAGFLALNRARHLLGDLAAPDELQTVLRGLPHNVTTEMDLALWQLTQKVRADSTSSAAFAKQSTAELTARYRNRTLPPAAQQGLNAFLRRYGHRAVAEIDLGMPRWSDDPSHIIGVVANYLRLDDPSLAPDRQFEAGARVAEAMLTELVGRAAAQNPVKARAIGFALRRARELVGLRESPKYLLVVSLGLLREQLGLVGAALVERGRVEVADDVYFLEFPEIRRALAGEPMAATVSERRTLYDAELKRRRIPRLLLTDGTEPEAAGAGAERPDGALAGSPASPGLVTGRARVVLDPVGAQLSPGEILVAPSTDPGWTPLFLTAGGLVMEMGGSNSHGAVVAREYGIPAVVGVPNATHAIASGDLITVDGSAGLISVVERAAAAVDTSQPVG